MLWANGTLYKRIHTTRLGEGIAFSPVLKQEAIERTVQAVCTFARDAKSDGAEQIFAFATAAVRSSKNGEEFCRRVQQACGLDVEIVSGEQEADLGLLGVLGGALDGGIVDIGGASTEICYRKDGGKTFSVSLPVGAVRLRDLCGEDVSKLRAEIDARVDSLAVSPVGTTYAIGGTATTLACLKLGLAEYDGNRVQGCALQIQEVRALSDKLFSLSVEERKGLVGMDARRADVIAGATLLLQCVMERLRLPAVTVSDSDNLEGYLALKGIL